MLQVGKYFYFHKFYGVSYKFEQQHRHDIPWHPPQAKYSTGLVLRPQSTDSVMMVFGLLAVKLLHLIVSFWSILMGYSETSQAIEEDTVSLMLAARTSTAHILIGWLSNFETVELSPPLDPPPRTYRPDEVYFGPRSHIFCIIILSFSFQPVPCHKSRETLCLELCISSSQTT